MFLDQEVLKSHMPLLSVRYKTLCVFSHNFGIMRMSSLNKEQTHRVEVAACLRGRGTHFVSGPCGGDDDCGGGGGDFVTVEGKATQSGFLVFTRGVMIPALDPVPESDF